MARTWQSEAIILKTWAIGEIHSGVWLLTRERGLVSVVAHGARSAHGSLRSACQGFNLGGASIYQPPPPAGASLKEFQVSEPFNKLKTELPRLLHASVWAEVFVKVHQDTPWEYELLASALRSLDGPDGFFYLRHAVQFFWRFLEQSGLRPDPDSNVRTGAPLAEDALCTLSGTEGGFVLAQADAEDVLSPGVRRYLSHTAGLGFAEAVRIGLAETELEKLFRSFVRFAETQFNVKIQSMGMPGLG